MVSYFKWFFGKLNSIYIDGRGKMKKLIIWEVVMIIVCLGIFFAILGLFPTDDPAAVVIGTAVTVVVAVATAAAAVAAVVVVVGSAAGGGAGAAVGAVAVVAAIAAVVVAAVAAGAGAGAGAGAAVGAVAVIAAVAAGVVADGITDGIDNIQAPKKWINISLITEALIIFGVMTATIFTHL